MSFFSITNPKKRDELIAEYLATVQRIKHKKMEERARDFRRYEAIEQSLEPVTRTAKESANAITKELLPIKEGIDKMNANLMQINDPVVKQEDDSTEKEEEKTDEGDIFQKILKYSKDEDIDPYFSIIENENGDYQMGNTIVQITKDDDLMVDDAKINGTVGLWSLIMFKKPKEGNYSMKDLEEYQRLVEMTNVMSLPNNLRRNSNVKGTYKWKHIFSRFDMHEGSGIKYLPGDIKGLQTDLAYLLGEFQAGNTSATRNKIVSISDQLLRRKNISQSEYRRINDFIQQ